MLTSIQLMQLAGLVSFFAALLGIFNLGVSKAMQKLDDSRNADFYHLNAVTCAWAAVFSIVLFGGLYLYNRT